MISKTQTSIISTLSFSPDILLRPQGSSYLSSTSSHPDFLSFPRLNQTHTLASSRPRQNTAPLYIFNMPNGTSSVGQNIGSCQSNPHSSTTSVSEDGKMQNYRLSLGTQQDEADLNDRLLRGVSTSYNHEAVMAGKIATIMTQFGTSGTTNGQ